MLEIKPKRRGVLDERDDKIRARFRRWKEHPAAFVREELHAEPDAWQEEALELFPKSPRLALKACKGPGKTALLAWLILNFLCTRPHPRIGATSITEGNLNANLWPELAKWMARSAFCTAMFLWSKTAVVHRQHPSTWWAQARTWPKQADAEQQSNALAGLHADYVMWILDESGGMPQAVMTTCEAILASGIEGHVVQSGNPTHTTGPLHRACTVDRHLWAVVTITGDPERADRSPRISMEWAQQQIDSFGRDNPWVMVNVLGEFPPSSINALLGIEEVERAMRRHVTKDTYNWAQKRLGIDVARFGDDATIIFPRQGIASFRPVVMRVQNTITIAARIARAYIEWNAELILIDDTGHWGHGCVDSLITTGYPVIPIIASDPAIDRRYKNRSAEMWLEMAKWVRAGGVLPYDVEMIPELTERTYTFVGGVFVLEPKDQFKIRLGRSPDKSDGLAQTFAIPDQPGRLMDDIRGSQHAKTEFDPFERGERVMPDLDYNPFEPR
jgi:phage terminase large subunit